MFKDEKLQDYLETSSSIDSKSMIIAEWNMNFSDNIHMVGNYRYRPTEEQTSIYGSIPNIFDPNDSGLFYTGATDSDILIDGITDDSDEPTSFLKDNDKERLLYSLEDCFGKNRPRSGINKLRYGINSNVTHHANQEMFNRPRYYMSDRADQFKYWTSYRKDSGVERGISTKVIGSNFYIDDAAPFVIYKEPIPANRITVKMQTNVGSVDLGPFMGQSGEIPDPLFGEENRTVPLRWKIQTLVDGVWIDAILFDEYSTRIDGSNIIGPDGHVEIEYGLIVPDEYKDIFLYFGEYPSASLLPANQDDGTAFLVRDSSESLGEVHISVGGSYKTFMPEYGWSLSEDSVSSEFKYVTKMLVADLSYAYYEEFQRLSGLRLVAETMNKYDSTLDLIELSPRLEVDISEYVSSVSVSKSASDLGVAGLPVGQLLASTGSLSIFDYDDSFNSNNTYSIIAKYLEKNLKVKIYDITTHPDKTNYFIPIKTLYADGFPSLNADERKLSIALRDLFFYFESTVAPQILSTNASLSYAVSTLLDSIGFSNYTFLRLPGESDPVIPYFFIPTDMSVAEILQDLAIATQYTMFFDEYNNFVVMSKNYMLPAEGQRQTDVTLYGSPDTTSDGVVRNNVPVLANILEVASQDNEIFNSGTINYTTRYIQKSYGSIKQAYLLDRDKTWIYKPSLLWEVSEPENTKSVNDEISDQSAYSLSAIPLNSDLSAELPYVENRQIVNNILDLGEAVYWISKYSGYFYANGEVIAYDAVEYSVSGISSPVWITSVQEYQKYFANIPFNGKLYPTGRVRILAEPDYETINGKTFLKNGDVARHGRGQFGTEIVTHSAGLPSHWSSSENLRGCKMKTNLLFAPATTTIPETSTGKAGIDNVYYKKSERSGIIRNFLANPYSSDGMLKTQKVATQSDTVQSSALVFAGPSFSADESAQNYLTYVYKKNENSFTHFGTRMRIYGRIENSDGSIQTASGAMSYYTVTDQNPSANITLTGGGGGLAVMINPETNNGYYLEISALSNPDVSSESRDSANINNYMFYKLMQNTSYKYSVTENLSGVYDGQKMTALSNGVLQFGTTNAAVGDRVYLGSQTVTEESGYYVVVTTGSLTDKWVIKKDEDAIPVKLWEGFAPIIVDDGLFTGQSRIVSEDNTTVNDIAIEYQDIGSTRRFFLYLNNTQIATVDDTNPLPVYQNMALFVRGSSTCMFENVYAIANNYAQSSSFALDTPINSVFSDKEINSNQSLRKYAMSGAVQATYLTGISSSNTPKYSMYFEEFGTIMREAAYFKVRYDKAYPALYAKLIPTFNSIKGYTVSGFYGGAYGAEFLVFNATDTTLNLDETSGNYLRIQGITFTQNSVKELTVDEYFMKNSDFSQKEFRQDNSINSIDKISSKYLDIKASRMTYGKNDFSVGSSYIQDHDTANELMSWLVDKVTKPRKSVGLKVFGMQNIQLGDIVSINYKTSNGSDTIASPEKQFVVYNIAYDRDSQGPSMTIYVSGVE